MATPGRIFVGAAAHPLRALRALAGDPRGLRRGGRTLLAVGGLYALISAGLAAAGALPPTPALLALSPDNYYFQQALFLLPVLFSAWLTAGGTAYLLTRRGQGSFESLLAALAPALALPLAFLGLFAAALGVFLSLGGRQKDLMDLTAAPGIAQTVVVGYPLLAAAWALVLCVLAVRSARRVGRLRALGAGLAAGAVLLAFIAVFIR
jgi:hypothetical protein